MAFVLIQHLDPSHQSMLAEIIAKTTKMPVEEVKSGVIIKPDRVYVIPPNAFMAIADCVFQLSPRGKTPGSIWQSISSCAPWPRRERAVQSGSFFPARARMALPAWRTSRRKVASPLPRNPPRPNTTGCRAAPSTPVRGFHLLRRTSQRSCAASGIIPTCAGAGR